jgi:hypothetical protein
MISNNIINNNIYQLSDEDLEDIDILYIHYNKCNINYRINDYTLIDRIDHVSVYYNNDTIKIFIEGANDMKDKLISLKSLHNSINIETSKIYHNALEMLNKYQNYKIKLVGHSFGCYIIKYIQKKYNYNISQVKAIVPIYGDDIDYDDITIGFASRCDIFSIFNHQILGNNIKYINQDILITPDSIYHTHYVKFGLKNYEYVYVIDIIFLLILLLLVYLL